MLDIKDLQAIAQLIKAQVDPINDRLDTLERTMATKEDLADTKVLMAAYFDPKFGLLADQLKMIQEKQIPAEALDDAEDRLDVLEAVVKRHSREIEKLK